jgi:molybdopterin molybdotransferase
MLEVADARAAVLRAARRLPPTAAALTPAALGRVLAEDVRADLDSPPFTKALMDGYAVRAADAPAKLRIVREVSAGAGEAAAVGAGEAVRIFTGAPLPDGADAVVRQEDATVDGGWVTVGAVRPGANVLPRGTEMTAGDVVLPAGMVLTPAALGLLAAVGRTAADLYPMPRVGVLATGNELVEPAAVPGPGQIRNSNGPMLAAQAARAGAVPTTFGVGRDDRAALAALIRDGLAASDVLILSGGVSVGTYDLVPDVLRELGVAVHFHQVRMKPGKPLLFGTWQDALVFGLPGNPVSSFVGFELFVRPALRTMTGHPDPGPVVAKLPLTEAISAKNDRPTYHPARLEGPSVRPLPWFGSADLRGLLAADALLVLPPGSVQLDVGQVAEVVVL